MRQKQEFHDEMRRQFEQDMQALRHQFEKSRKEISQAQSAAPKPAEDSTTPVDTSPWWTRGRAAKCPALNGEEPRPNASKCPALYDEAGQAKTELDAYELLQKDKNTKDAQVFEASDQSDSKKPSRSWFSSFGWDGKRRGKTSSDSQEVTKATDTSLARPTTYVMFGSRRMDPFSNADQTIPWLMLSPYSPIYLCNPAQPRLFKVRIQESEGAPFQISRPRFFEKWYSDVDEKMAKAVPWADAFEDLLSLQQTGKMVDRDYATWRTPNTWIHDMVHRGSLGSRWGFDQDGFLTKKPDSTKAIAPTSSNKDGCSWRRERGRHCGKQAEEVETSNPVLDDDFVDDLIDKATKPLAPFPVFGTILSAADAIVAAVEETAKGLEKAASQPSPETMEKFDATPAADEPSVPSISTSSPSSHTYESSFSSVAHDQSDDTRRIVGTLTSTSERTLPDGSIETKRVFRRRFADGTEEVDESVDVRNIPRGQPRTSHGAGKDKQTQTTSPAADPASQALARGPQGLAAKEMWAQQPQSQSEERSSGSTTEPIVPTQDALFNDDEAAGQDHTAAPEPQKPRRQDSEQRRRGGWFWT